MEDRPTMKNQKVTGKSKLYCNRCGSFDLTKSNRGFVAKFIFDEPKKLHCQSCDTKLSFQKIASNLPLTPPSLYAKSDSTVLSNDKLGRPIYVTIDDYVSSANEETASLNSQWVFFLRGVFGGLALFGVLISLFLISPFSKLGEINAEVYLEPIMRLGEVEVIRLDNTNNKNADMEVALLEDPKKAPDDLVWEEVAGSISGLSRKAAAEAIKPVLIQEDQSSEKPPGAAIKKQDSSPDLSQPVKTILQDLDRLLKN
jgi:hypothetical protein